MALPHCHLPFPMSSSGANIGKITDRISSREVLQVLAGNHTEIAFLVTKPHVIPGVISAVDGHPFQEMQFDSPLVNHDRRGTATKFGIEWPQDRGSLGPVISWREPYHNLGRKAPEPMLERQDGPYV